MNELAKIFDSLANNYEKLYKQASESVESTGFMTDDFLTLEPFYFEIYHIPTDNIKIYRTTEELPDNVNYLHLVGIQNGRMIFARNAVDVNTHYDTFFQYDENQKQRCQVFVKNGEVTPMLVERLTTNPGGSPAQYERYSKHYGSARFTYHWSDSGAIVQRDYIDDLQNVFSSDQLEVTFNKGFSRIEQIEEISKEKRTTLYSVSTSNNDLPTLLKKAALLIKDKIIAGIEKQTPIKDEVNCLLLEYTMQGPFPPTVALLLTEEKEKYIKEYGDPLVAYNAPDCEWFSEGENFRMDFYSERDLFDEINKRIEELEFEDSKKLIFDFYVELCKNLKRNNKLKQLLVQSSDFHVIARDFEECNEYEYLSVLLPEAALKKLDNDIASHKEKSGLSQEDQQLVDSLETDNKEKEALYPILKADNEKFEGEVLFSDKREFYLKPFEYEVQRQAPNPYASFASTSQLAPQTDKNSYFLYKLDNNRVMYMADYQSGELIREYYYVYTGDTIIEYEFHVAGNAITLENYSELHFSQGMPERFNKKDSGETTEIIYAHDKHGRPLDAISTNVYIARDMDIKMERTSKYFFKYNEEGELSRVSNKVIKADKQIAPDSVRETVQYCIDNSYIDETARLVIQLATNHILKLLTKKKLETACALAIEKNDQLPFPIFHCYLARKGKNGVRWTDLNMGYDLSMDDHAYLNFNVYTSRKQPDGEKHLSSKVNYIDTVEKTFQQLAQELENNIKEQFGIQIPVLIRNSLESIEIINEQLTKMLSKDKNAESEGDLH